jgi:signal peptidase I
MSRRQPAASERLRDSRPSGSPVKAPADPKRRQQRRESVESFVVVLAAFLIWSFEAEGFVIPTGSMAPTLMGRHKEVTCPECGYVYRVNADCEVDSSGAGAATGLRVAWGTCEICRFETRVDDIPSSSGDRIYTMKSGLHLPLVPALGQVGPGRFEVVVFKLPEEPEVRYIKRLVGLPGETIRIRQGDLYRRGHSEPDEFQRLRRPLPHQQAMQVMVYDDSHRPRSLRDDPRWSRWAGLGGGWTETTAGSFRAAGPSNQWNELRYRHLVPDLEQWQAIREGKEPARPPRATLITDFSSFNTDLTAQAAARPRTASRRWFQPHWVGDLTLSAAVDVARPAGQLRLELIKGGHVCRCELDLANGSATLFRDGVALTPSTATELKRPGRHSLALANVDDRVTLWVDGELPFGEGVIVGPEDPEAVCLPTAEDLQPARIAARDVDLAVSNLVLKRDIYYTLEPGEPDYNALGGLAYRSPSALTDLLADPERYAQLGPPPSHDYSLGPGRFLMLGDNSPWSRDGRAWGTTDQINPLIPGRGWDDSGRESWEVPESLIIGKAFSVYWPRPKPVWPALRVGKDYRLPVRPYVERMRWIR